MGINTCVNVERRRRGRGERGEDPVYRRYRRAGIRRASSICRKRVAISRCRISRGRAGEASAMKEKVEEERRLGARGRGRIIKR